MPLFLPTSFGAVPVVAALPEARPMLPRAVLFLTGGRAHSSRPLFIKLGRIVASRGYPAVQIDFPGTGLSEQVKTVGRQERATVVQEVIAWFRNELGCTKATAVGHCYGGVTALKAAGADPQLDQILAYACPLRVRVQHRKTKRLRSGLAALDGVGPVATRLLSKGRRSTAADVWLEEVYPGILGMSEQFRIEFVYGSLDEYAEDLKSLRELDPSGISCRVGGKVLDGTKLQGFPRVEDHPLVEKALVDLVNEGLDG